MARSRPLRRLLLRATAFAGAVTAAANALWCLRSQLTATAGSIAMVGASTVSAESEASAAPPLSPCEEVRRETLQNPVLKMSRWQKAAAEGRTIHAYGIQASRLLNRTLANFDSRVRASVGEGQCDTERQALDQEVRQQITSIFLVQRSMVEQVLFQRLKKDLLRQMQRKSRELTMKEKLRLFHAAMHDYDVQVRELLPFFITNSERDRAEKRLSELQWGIVDMPEAKEMLQRWQNQKMRRLSMRQNKGFSLSMSPGMRLMFRPSGLGNLQISSRRQVGPPHNPNEVSIGVLNDGKVMDVYNKQPNPPLIKFQPTIGIDISAG